MKSTVSRSLLLLLCAWLLVASNAFSIVNTARRTATTCAPLRMSDPDQRGRLEQLGFTEQELDRSAVREPVERVNVNEVEIDAVTLTAVGFGLIALNFLVFANMGDGGIAGVVATIINTWGN